MTSAVRLLKPLSPPSPSLCSLIPAGTLPSPGPGSGITMAPAAGGITAVTSGDLMEVLGNPDIAYILMIIGILGVVVELATPGITLPGVVGVISLILALVGFTALPVNIAGVLLILLTLLFLIAEIRIVSHGVLTLAGVVSLVFGSLLLYDSADPSLRVSWSVVAVAAGSLVGFSLCAVSRAVRAHRSRATTGKEGIVGESGRTVTELAPEGKVFVRGEYWDARCDGEVGTGEAVTVTGIEGMVLKVTRVKDEG